MSKFLTSICIVVALLVSPLRAAITSSQITISSAATLIVMTSPSRSESIVIINHGSVSVFLGPSNVTTSTGVEIKPEGSVSMFLSAVSGGAQSVYGITASSTARVDLLESK